MTDETLHFRANTRLKDLIGRGLILNDNVAIIELIKNSSDANSPEVFVKFKKASTASSESKLIVQDIGDGMNLEDFRTKWLNIAFSGKRNQLNQNRAFAGEKGVGRFSCDRLGRRLTLVSKRENDEAFEATINWEDFEEDDINKEISSVDITVRVLSEAEYTRIAGQEPSGTTLIIDHLRSVWDSDKLMRLKKELERFIIDPDKRFRVYLKSFDIKGKSGRLIFDDYIENRLFEKLDEKTTSVHSTISADGSDIKTEIRHDGQIVLRYHTPNHFFELQDIKVSVQIHYLNPGAKISFKNITGYSSAEYGSVMMFLNGFRVMPYGEPDNDWLGLNRRKAQGTSRNLGGREVFGRVEITDKNRIIIPVTSREGVENNIAFSQLASPNLGAGERSFVHSAFHALETYVVRGLDWDRVEPKDGQYSYQETLKAMLSAVNQIENRHKLTSIEINGDRIREIARAKIAEYDSFVSNLKKDVADKSAYDLTASEKRKVAKFIGRVDAQVQAAHATNQEIKKTAQAERKRRLFAEALAKPDARKNEELMHHIRLLSDKIGGELIDAMQALHSVSLEVDLTEVERSIQSALFNNGKLAKLARIIARADFDMMSDTLTEDVLSYIEQYINDLTSINSTYGLRIKYNNHKNINLPLSFSPIEVVMLIDNVLENARTAEAKKIDISVDFEDDFIELSFKNNGNKLTDRYEADDLFQSGITTTTGSGIGLAQVSRIAEALDATVRIEDNSDVGVSVIVRWRK